MSPPRLIEEAKVIRWSPIDSRHRPTGNCRHVPQGTVASLAIGRHDDDAGYYLFGCDAEWNAVTDTWHDSLEDALLQAEFEYEGVNATWNVVSP